MKKKVAWLLCMAGLCLVLYTIVVSRMESSTDVIFGGAEGAYVKSDSVTFIDMNATPTPEPTVDIWPQLTQSDFENNRYLDIVNNNNLLSSAYEPDSVSRITSTKYMLFSTEYLPYLDAFIEAINDAGFEVYVAGAYRSYSYQNELFNSKASQIAYEMAGGVDVDYTDPIYQEAVEEAKKITAYPGSSEHQLGLAVDLLDRTIPAWSTAR
ncbi:MAG: D-alanyl-D-alanine carboxypeptidase family protein [Oscillospiraceae bacterium]